MDAKKIGEIGKKMEEVGKQGTKGCFKTGCFLSLLFFFGMLMYGIIGSLL